MIIVSDTTPLRYLILIDQIELLPRFFQEIVVPKSVYDELTTEKAPIKVTTFMASLPSWMSVLPNADLSDPGLFEIDEGERQAILLAEKLMADGILIDDLAGRKAAEMRGIFVIGTLGVLEVAARNGDIDFRTEITKIRKAGFYVTDELELFFLKKLGLD